MKIIRNLLIAALPLLGATTGLYAGDDMADMPMPGHEHHAAHSAALTEAQAQFLSGYEAVRAALAADDLDAAKTAAAMIMDSPSASSLTKAPSLNAARVAFKKLSAEAVALAHGRNGYYVVTCSMVESDWVQTTKGISNPYLGKQQATCGQIKN